jgi:hypothetical protein
MWGMCLLAEELVVFQEWLSSMEFTNNLSIELQLQFLEESPYMEL